MTHELTDHLGRKVVLPKSPKRMISICPAITETLFSLGLEKEIVGRTKYCIFPKGIVDQVQMSAERKRSILRKSKRFNRILFLLKKRKTQKK